jgi:hypothetical protein
MRSTRTTTSFTGKAYNLKQKRKDLILPLRFRHPKKVPSRHLLKSARDPVLGGFCRCVSYLAFRVNPDEFIIGGIGGNSIDWCVGLARVSAGTLEECWEFQLVSMLLLSYETS